VEDARELGRQQLGRRPLVGAGERVEELQLAVGVERTGEGPQRLDRHAGNGLGSGDQAVGQPVAGQFDDHVVHGDAVAPFQHVEGDDVHPRVAERGGDGAQDAGAVGDHQAQEIGHGASGSSSACGAISVDREASPSHAEDPRNRPRRVARSQGGRAARRRAAPKWSSSPA
jgi:hypothetical protein